MKIIVLHLRLILLMSACFTLFTYPKNGLCGSLIENPVLKWKKGDKWQVKTWNMAVDYSKGKLLITKKSFQEIVQFEVSGISTSRYGDCYVVNVVYPKDPTGFQFSYNLFYSCKDGRLLSVVENSTRSNGTKIDTHYHFIPGTNMPTLTERVRSGIPFDLPAFSEGGADLVAKEESREIRQKIAPDKEGQGFTTTITVKTARGEERQIVQKWEPGLPWWKELKEYKGGELIKEQELVLDEGGITRGTSQPSTNSLTK